MFIYPKTKQKSTLLPKILSTTLNPIGHFPKNKKEAPMPPLVDKIISSNEMCRVMPQPQGIAEHKN
jgi:hypothetical protein